MHDGRDGVEEGKLGFAGQCLDGARQRRRGEGAGRHDDAVPIGGRQARDLPRAMSMSGCASSAAVTCAAKPSRSTASAPPAGSLLASAAAMISEEARRISSWSSPTALVSHSSERNEFEHTSSASAPVLMRFGLAVGPHLVEHDRHAATRELPGRLAACQSTPDDMNFARHG